MKGSHGGARPGGGRPKGMKWPSTLRKEEARELVRRYVTERLPEYLDAMSDNITGIRHLMMRDPKSGKFERITGDAKQIDKALKTKTAFWIYTKDPNVQAFTDLLNRCIDKPSEHVHLSGADDGPIQIQWMSRDEKESVIDTDNESDKVLELSRNVDDRIRRARKVNGH